MGKPLLLAIAPVASQSGYGKHAQDIVRSLIRLDKFDVKIFGIRWGDTPLNALVPGADDDIISRLLPTPQLPRKPEISVQITIPPEFQPVAEFNIGITAGIETTVPNPTWLEGLNRMHLNIVPSEHSKKVFTMAEFVKNDDRTKQPIGHLKLERPLEVLFEGADTTKYKRTQEIHQTVLDELAKIPEEFCFLFVGHWLQGSLGNDRKDVSMLVKTFYETFKDKPNQPALILKTSSATFSILDRNDILRRIESIKSMVSGNLPNVYVLHGQLTDEEMNSLYNHSKVKATITLTKGEGFGRPLLEFTMSGKPVIASGWSGHIDFLDKELAVLIPGELKTVDASAVNDFIIKDSQWFCANYNIVSNVMQDIFANYHRYFTNSKKLMYINKDRFSLEQMQKQLGWILERHLPEFPEEVELRLPIKKISLPKIQKKEQSVGETK